MKTILFLLVTVLVLFEAVYVMAGRERYQAIYIQREYRGQQMLFLFIIDTKKAKIWIFRTKGVAGLIYHGEIRLGPKGDVIEDMIFK